MMPKKGEQLSMCVHIMNNESTAEQPEAHFITCAQSGDSLSPVFVLS